MTWKSTALVSGAGLLATWLAAVPAPPLSPATSGSAAVPRRAPAAADSAIAHEAERLARRAQRLPAYAPATRNPFRFRAPAATAAAPTPTRVVETGPVVTPPVVPSVHLAGVAMDRIDGRDVWTAILSSPKGVLLVREGETAGDGLVVGAIGADRVELRRPDGSILTLPLSGK